MKQTLVGPNSRVTVYDMPFNEKNLKTLFEKRIDDNISFVVKDSRMARDVRDATGIASKTLELMTLNHSTICITVIISALRRKQS